MGKLGAGVEKCEGRIVKIEVNVNKMVSNTAQTNPGKSGDVDQRVQWL